MNEATDFRLLIQRTTVKKVKYLLHRFKDIEWSGPAWYKITKKTKQGFPIRVRLEHFIPIDLGSAAETELDGEKLGKMLPKVYKKRPELGECFLGLIHSHHKMGAFFSGTDKDTLLNEATASGIYFSTVVASEKEKYVTALAYLDQYGFPRMVEGEVKAMDNVVSEPEWRYEADKIAKAKKKEEKNTWKGHHYGYNYNQGLTYNQYNMFGNNVKSKVVKDGEVEDIPNPNQVELLGAGIPGAEPKDKVDEKIADLYNKFEGNEITEDEFVEKVRKIDPDIEPHWYIDQGWM